MYFRHSFYVYFIVVIPGSRNMQQKHLSPFLLVPCGDQRMWGSASAEFPIPAKPLGAAQHDRSCAAVDWR